MTRFTTLSFIIAALLSASVLHAQEAKPLARHPGDVVGYEIKFDGPNADRIKSVRGGLSMRVAPPKDQSGFDNGFGGVGKMSSPKTFSLEITIPNNAATGDYYLNVGANADEGSAGYQDGQEFNVPAVRIENPKKFTPPSITVIPQL